MIIDNVFRLRYKYKICKGTALEGRITINMVVSEAYYDLLDSGEYDICNNGWNGGASDPYRRMCFFVTTTTRVLRSPTSASADRPRRWTSRSTAAS